MEFRIRWASDGEQRWVHVHGSTLPGPDRTPPLIFGLTQDVTGRRQAEKALSESEERLALALDGSMNTFWDWDIPSGRVLTGERWLTMLGYAPDSFPVDFETWAGPVHPEDFPATEALLREHLEGRAPVYEATFRIRAADGSWRHVLDRGKVVARDAEGRPLRMAGTHSDVTRQVAGREALRESEALLRTMIKSLPVGFWARGLDGRVILQSDRSMELWGDLRGQGQGDSRFDEATLAVWRENNRQALMGDTVQGDVTLRPRNGRKRLFHNVVAPIRDAGGIRGVAA